MRREADPRVNPREAGERARAWADVFAASGLEACLGVLRAELSAATEGDLPALTRALRYFHQVLLPEPAARVLGTVFLVDEDPRLAPRGGDASPRLAALEHEWRALAGVLAAEEAREPDLLRAAGEHDALSEEEGALESERRALERALEDAGG